MEEVEAVGPTFGPESDFITANGPRVRRVTDTAGRTTRRVLKDPVWGCDSVLKVLMVSFQEHARVHQSEQQPGLHLQLLHCHSLHLRKS